MANPNPSPESVKRGYEHGEVRIRWFVVAVVGMAVFAAIMFGALWHLVKTESQVRPVDRRTSAVPGYSSVASLNDAAPPLQPSQRHDQTAAEDLESMRRREDHIFIALGWRVDQATHHATPPAELVQQVAQRIESDRISRSATTQKGMR